MHLVIYSLKIQIYNYILTYFYSLFWLSPITVQMHALNYWCFLNFPKYTIKEQHLHRCTHIYKSKKEGNIEDTILYANGISCHQSSQNNTDCILLWEPQKMRFQSIPQGESDSLYFPRSSFSSCSYHQC